jgi:hypothetical protein
MSDEIENFGRQQRPKLPQTAAYLDPVRLSALIQGQATGCNDVGSGTVGVQHPGHDLGEERLEGAPLGRKRLERPRFALRSGRCGGLAILAWPQTNPVSAPG